VGFSNKSRLLAYPICGSILGSVKILKYENRAVPPPKTVEYVMGKPTKTPAITAKNSVFLEKEKISLK
jgi:hypothetical protein